MSNRVIRMTAMATGTLLGASLLNAQATVPVRDLSPPDARSTTFFGDVFGLQEIAGGEVIVNDGAHRQLILLDSRLARRRTILDSIASGPNGYGPVASPLIRFMGDSSIFVDGASQSLIVIDSHGQVARTIAAPARNDMRFLAGGRSTTDDIGNLYYRVAPLVRTSTQPTVDGVQTVTSKVADSALLVRASFATGVVDTVAQIDQPSKSSLIISGTAGGKTTARFVLHPMESMDEWVALPNGMVAILRGHDYHIDWISMNGKRSSSARIPTDLLPLPELGKLAFIDSLNRSTAATLNQAKANRDAGMLEKAIASIVSQFSAGLATYMAPPSAAQPTRRAGGAIPTDIGFVNAAELPDFRPPFRQGALSVDYDGNLWILPFASSASKAGELVYDVVNADGKLFQRVRLPVGRALVGFGRGKTVYLATRTGAGTWVIERTKLQ